jgi:hypothetical protein
VHDPVLMGVVEPARGLGRDPERVVDRELPLPPEPVAQRLSLDVRHGEPELPAGLAGVMDGQDVRMLQPGGQPDLPLEPLGAQRRGQLGQEDFQRDRPVVPEVLGQVDRGHAPAAELALDRVSSLQSFL